MRDFIKTHELQVHLCIILFALISIWNFSTLPNPKNAEIEYANALNEISRLIIYKQEKTLFPPFVHLLCTLVSSLLLISTIIWAHGERHIKLALFCFMLLFTVPFSVGVKAANAFQRPWLTIHTIKGPDKNKYSFLSYSKLQSQKFCLGKLESNDEKARVYKIVGETDNDAPRTRIALVRPENMIKAQSRLIKTDNGWLLGVSFNSICYFAYDVKANKFYGKADLLEDSIYSISNFFLIDEDDELNKKDVKVLINSVKKVEDGYDFENQVAGSPPGIPRMKILKKALDHPNQNVKDLTKRILEIIDSRKSKKMKHKNKSSSK